MSGFPLGTPIWPVVTLERIGGRPEVAEDAPRVRLRVWDSSKTKAEDLITKLALIVERADGERTQMGSAILVATAIDRMAWLPDESVKVPSYLMDATLVFIS